MVMYWYKKKNTGYKAVIAIAVTALFLSCNSNPKDGNLARETYFDIPGHFKMEIMRLVHEKPIVDKTVIKDSLSETKEMKIPNWENELASFVSIDLNKPAYAGILKKDSTAHKIKITSSDPKIDITAVEIEYGENGEPAAFHIQRNIQNSLYETRETLRYAKNKGYSLEKHQSIFLLGDKYYRIEGVFRNQTVPKKSPGH